MHALSGDAAQRANSASASASAVCSPLRSASATLLAPSSNNAAISSPSVSLTASSMKRETAHRKSEQSRRREPRPVPERTKLRPDHIRSDTPPSCRGVEAAIARGAHGGSVSDHGDDPFDSIRYHLGVLDDVGQRVDHAGHQNLSGLQRKVLEAAEFMRVTRAGEGQIQSPDFGLPNDWQDVLERYVAVMRTFRIAPTHVQAHTV